MDNAALLRAQAEANEMRGTHLSAVREGFLTPEDVIELAAQDGYEPLKRIRLMRLLTSAQGIGEVSASKLIQELILATKSIETSRQEVNIAWLIDRRACGRRLVTWANLRRRHEPPWPGFPYTPKPLRKVDQHR